MRLKTRVLSIVVLGAVVAGCATDQQRDGIRIALQFPAEANEEYRSMILLVSRSPMDLSSLSLSTANNVRFEFEYSGFSGHDPNGCYRLERKDGSFDSRFADFTYVGSRVEVTLREWVDAAYSLKLTLHKDSKVTGIAIFAGSSSSETPIAGTQAASSIEKCIDMLGLSGA
jgi:hypothetical protein